MFVSVTDTQDFQNQSRTTYEDAPYFLISSCALFLFGLVTAPPAQAQANSWELGPLLGVNFDEAYLGSKNNELLIGGVSRVHLSSLPISLNPGLEFYPGVDNGSLFVLNFDAQYQLEAETVKPYVGAGISWARFAPDGGSSSSDIGLSLKGGLVFNPASRTRPYGEAVLNFSDGTEGLIVRGGVLFAIGN